MKKITAIAITAATLLCLGARTSWAAGAYVVDDAAIVDPGQTQVESWYSRSNTGENLGVVDAAYQLLPHAEFLVEETHDVQASNGNDMLAAQVKYLWREGDDAKNIASSAVFGLEYAADHRKLSGLYAYVPSTWAASDALDFNADFGWEYDQQQRRHFATWGTSAEYHTSTSLSFVGEIFGKNEGRPGMQLGPRLTVSPDLMFDAIYGRDLTGTTANWLTAGVTMTF